MIEKKCRQNVIKSTLFLLISSILVLLDKLKDYHITGIQFFSILFILFLPIILYKIIKYDDLHPSFGFFIALHILIYALFFYLSVFYIFIPACTLINLEGIIKFFVMIVVFLIASVIGAFITFIPVLFDDTENNTVLAFIFGITIILSIASSLILFSFSRTLLSWGFNVEYQNIIIQNSSKFMISLMNFLFK